MILNQFIKGGDGLGQIAITEIIAGTFFYQPRQGPESKESQQAVIEPHLGYPHQTAASEEVRKFCLRTLLVRRKDDPGSRCALPGS
jgi:hypothetical protein